VGRVGGTPPASTREETAVPTFEYALTIDAPPARVWDLVSDVQGWPSVTASVTSVEALDGAELAVSGRFVLVQPKLRRAVWTVTALRPGSDFHWESKAPGVVTRGDHLVEEADGGGSRLTVAIVQSGPLGWLIGRLAGGLTRRYMEMEAQGFKARAEAPAGA
jgi:uncharacterized membrane protein